MCIILLAYDASRRYPLIVAANRDEHHGRPTAAAHWWADPPHVLGGRDLEAGGTWLGMARDGRVAAVTNLREDTPARPGEQRSRGTLPIDYLSGAVSARAFAASAAADGERFGAFNLLLLDGSGLHYSSNRAEPRTLPAGVHAVANDGPDAGWPKVLRARERLAALIEEPDPAASLFALLAERHPPVPGYDHQVSLFRLDPVWGTRSSTVILMNEQGKVRFIERSFDRAGKAVGEVRFDFAVAGKPR